MADRTHETGGLGACPHCGTPLAPATGRSSIDKPFQQCAECARFVRRRGANEWDLLRPSQKLGHVARRSLGALTMGSSLALAHSIAVLGAGRSWQLRDALVWLAAGWVLAGAWEGSRLMARIRRSRRRMGDPMYLAKLVEYEMTATSRR